MSQKIDELNSLLEFQRNPSLASLKVLASIADSFGKLSDIPLKPMHERLNTLLRNKDEAQFKELSSIAEALSLMADRGTFKGDQGDQGERGIQGPQGEPGLDGIDGKDGSDGAPGKDGSAGPGGKDGRDGERGPAGRNGTDGADGLDGVNGRDGRDGLDGKDGSPDTPEEILEKLKTIGLQAEDIKGLEKYVDSYTLQQVIDSLWHRTQYLVNRSSSYNISDYIKMSYRSVSSSYELDASDYTIDCVSGTFTVTLRTAVGITGKIYNIKNSGNGIITLATTSSQTIDGDTTGTLAQYDSLTVQSNGANWIIV